MMFAWMRELSVTLTSPTLNQSLTFSGDDIAITVKGAKYMSSMKDSCTIELKNLPYSRIIQIIQGKYYNVDVICGYKSAGKRSIFKGGVVYISNKFDDTKTSTCVILCASYLIARYSQSRINLSLNSGINMYAAIKFVMRATGLSNINIDDSFKDKQLTELLSVDSTAASWIDTLIQANSSYIVNSDPSLDSAVMTIYDSMDRLGLVYKLKNSDIILTGGFPRLNSNGITLSLMPTTNFRCGDIIQIDNSIIDFSVTDTNQIGSSGIYYLDKDGYYLIYEIDFRLENRGYEFTTTMLCKPRQSLLGTILGS